MNKQIEAFTSLNLLLFYKHYRGNMMEEKHKLKKDIRVSARIDKDLEDFMKTFSAAKGKKYMAGGALVELAEMAREMILKESDDYKSKIANMVKQHKESKLEKATKVLDALDEVGLELTEKAKEGKDDT